MNREQKYELVLSCAENLIQKDKPFLSGLEDFHIQKN